MPVNLQCPVSTHSRRSPDSPRDEVSLTLRLQLASSLGAAAFLKLQSERRSSSVLVGVHFFLESLAGPAHLPNWHGGLWRFGVRIFPSLTATQCYKKMLSLINPDKHGGSERSTEATCYLLEMWEERCGSGRGLVEHDDGADAEPGHELLRAEA